MQEICPAFHTFEDPCLSFFAQFHTRDTGLCHKADKGFRLMGVQAITYKCPWSLRVCFCQCNVSMKDILKRVCQMGKAQNINMMKNMILKKGKIVHLFFGMKENL